MAEFNLRELVRQVRLTSVHPDPKLITKEVSRRIKEEDCESALEQALPYAVTKILKSFDVGLPTPPPAPKSHQTSPGDQNSRGQSHAHAVAGGSTQIIGRNAQLIYERYQMALSESIAVDGRGTYKFVGDCTRDDLYSAASINDAQARANAERARVRRGWADLIQACGVTYLKELPREVVEHGYRELGGMVGDK